MRTTLEATACPADNSSVAKHKVNDDCHIDGLKEKAESEIT